jgi:hypothetical protein
MLSARTMDTGRILSVTKLSEISNLSDTNKELFKLIISAGTVDLHEDLWVRDRLWTMFPEGSVTGDALRDPDNRFILVANEPTPIP